MKILVTGTAGFIGFHLTKKLSELGHEVIGLDSINEYYDVQLKYDRLKELGFQTDNLKQSEIITSNKFINLKFIKCALEDLQTLEKLFEEERFDAVCNLAAQAGVRYSLQYPKTYIDSNIYGFLNILECCRHYKVNNLCYASSSSVYGLNKEMPLSETDSVNHPISLYAATKRSNELMAHTYSHLFNIRTTGLRFFTVYGPWGRPDMALFLFTKAALEHKSIKVFNRGEMFRDFTFIDDIIDGIILVLLNPPSKKENFNHTSRKSKPNESSAPFSIRNIGNSSTVKLMDFISEIENILGITLDKELLEIQPGDVPKTNSDITSLETLGYKPKTNYKLGIRKFIEWYINYYEKQRN